MASERERLEGNESELEEGLKVKVNWREVKISDLITFLSNIFPSNLFYIKFHFRYNKQHTLFCV